MVVGKTLKRVFGMNPKTDAEAEQDFNKQRESDFLKWKHECDEGVKNLRRLKEDAIGLHSKLVNDWWELEMASGRNYRSQSKEVSKKDIKDKVNQKVADIETLKRSFEGHSLTTRQTRRQETEVAA